MENIDKELLVRYLQGKCSLEESAAVEAWESQSADNKRIVEQLYFILQASDCLHTMHAASPQSALVNLKKEIETRKRLVRVHRIVQVTQRIAAILLIPVLLLAGYYIWRDYNETFYYVEVKTNSGMVSSFDLPDGSKVWLNAGGKLKYPAKFTSNRRDVYLKGQGYFSVKRDEETPFIVHIDDFYSVEVLGTEFNVSAYEDDNLIETTLVSGKVKLNIHFADGRFMQQLLQPNEKLTFNRRTKKWCLATVDTESDKVWREGKIVFRQHPMRQVLKVLGRYYNVRFEVKNPSIMHSKITAKFTNEPLQQVLEYLELASDIKFKTKHPSRIENDTLFTSVIELYEQKKNSNR